MIFLHLIFGIILGSITGNYVFSILGATIADIDHIYIILKNKLFTVNKIIDSEEHEKKYHLHYKTPFMHSISGLVVLSIAIFTFNKEGAIIFAIGYFSHLLLDWIDIDEKYLLYPLKIKFYGFLPIWSKPEKILTIISMIVLIIILS